MKKIILYIFFTTFYSCSTYLDVGSNIKSEKLDFIYHKDYNEFIYKSDVNSSADNEIYITTNFSEHLPKKILNWKVRGNEFYFKYSEQQSIYIKSGNMNLSNSANWTVKNADKENISKIIKDYENLKEYNFNIRKDRISKIYSDGRVSILLLNIKKENINNFLNLIKNFKYLN